VLYFNVYGVYTRETLLGIIVGIPLVLSTIRFKKFPFKKFLGDLSYTVYLTHFLLIWFLDYLKWDTDCDLCKIVVMTFLTVTVSSLIVVITAKTVERYRLGVKSQKPKKGKN